MNVCDRIWMINFVIIVCGERVGSNLNCYVFVFVVIVFESVHKICFCIQIFDGYFGLFQIEFLCFSREQVDNIDINIIGIVVISSLIIIKGNDDCVVMYVLGDFNINFDCFGCVFDFNQVVV